ncbi:(deoxy)nucleoside triphosphate pyrophosphohydrolase [Altererythrobacter sp.]|nr:(deoxy)nucleoside triphosphate pyrophosphohydrolase [Altererythrobacter sp.]
MEKNFTTLLVVAAALRDNCGRVLMHRRPCGKEHGGLWEFPGGKVEPGETAREAIVREIKEETGLSIAAGALSECGFAEGVREDNESALVILLYTATEWSGEPLPLDGGELAWCDQAQIAQLEKPPLDILLAGQLFDKES